MNTNLHTQDVTLEYQILDELNELGFQIAEPEGLDSSAFPDTFSPSAFHELVRRSASKTPETDTRWAGSDWAFRHVDLDKIGFSPIHLSAFKMLVFLEAVSHNDAKNSRERTVQIVIKLLKHWLKLKPDQLYITYFAGHLDLPSGLVDENEIPTLWMREGVLRQNLIAISGTANLTNVVRTEEPAGPRCEVFLRDTHGTFVEIATVVFESLIVTKTYPLAFKPSAAAVCGAAFGLERCEMVSRHARDIFQLPELESALAVIESDLPPPLAELGTNDVRRIVDGVRTTMVIAHNTRQQLNRARRDRIRELRKSIVRAGKNLGYEDMPALVERIANALQETGEFNGHNLTGTACALLWGVQNE